MNVVLIGSGGREHAIAYKISESKNLDELYIIPGNPGTEKLGKNIDLDSSNHSLIIEFCKNNNIDLVIIGPEIPLVDGLADSLRANEINVFGPNKKAAEIEGDKSFSKDLMKKYNIPTASFKVFTKEEYNSSLEYLNRICYPTVIKASGLAAGKGVAICESKKEAEEYVKQCFNESLFGSSGETLIIEEFLQGEEASIFAITDGDNFVLLPAAQDHKRRFDGDIGPNTGGMGAYAPAPLITDEILKKISKKVIIPTLEAMKSEGRKYNGCLYAGIMINNGEPSVVEFNCRFGDPETQVVLPIIKGDFLELLSSTAKGNINKASISVSNKNAITVVAASDGYPGSYKKGFEITGIEDVESENIWVFHAGTKKEENILKTNGGRVLNITAISDLSLSDAKNLVYSAISKIEFEGKVYRKDISDKAK
ncbi:MAG: phosphoribosylamine--glycine ligase [Bacteroidetes bacterium]|nr:phosphoribosylamine--glycine ligase [Bacteroidota bacterium]MBU1113884.1 phosphoribosylamine--glycine ligase [Bacteroidota bacterium]MBU1798090.1 phosphoribosylamine--glycine ligase [Bacteroidota bacterium]